jgi:hypothetical protein
MLFLELFGYLLLILVAAEIFVNALEHLGEKLKISEGVTGSLFAAVGTAMPETLVPLLAIFAGTGSSAVNQEMAWYHSGRALIYRRCRCSDGRDFEASRLAGPYREDQLKRDLVSS